MVPAGSGPGHTLPAGPSRPVKALDPPAGVGYRQSNSSAAEGIEVTTASTDGLRFVPSAVEGLLGVTEVVVFPDRLELLSEGRWVVVRFLDIARWHRFGWLHRPLARFGFRVRGWPAVADRDWFHPPAGRFFRFFTAPPVTVFMPDEPPETSYGQTMFRRVQEVLAAGGFSTFDLG